MTPKEMKHQRKVEYIKSLLSKHFDHEHSLFVKWSIKPIPELEEGEMPPCTILMLPDKIDKLLSFVEKNFGNDSST